MISAWRYMGNLHLGEVTSVGNAAAAIPSLTIGALRTLVEIGLVWMMAQRISSFFGPSLKDLSDAT
jgi:hypothetical protein